jgi:hypothetical protein
LGLADAVELTLLIARKDPRRGSLPLPQRGGFRRLDEGSRRIGAIER